MKAGIIGGSMSGKTTLFNVLSGAKQDVGTGSREIHISNVKVPDERIDKLSEVYQPKKTTYAEIDFVDFGGGFDSKTEAKIIAKIREMDTIAIVLGAYKTDSEKELLNELDSILTEMVLIDLIACENRIERMEKKNKKDLEYQTLQKFKNSLEIEQLLNSIDISSEEKKAVSSFSFLTEIPVIVIINVSERDFNKKTYTEIEKLCKQNMLDYLYISGNVEMEIAELPCEDQKDFLDDIGVDKPARDRFIRKVYEKMNLISFFTTGKDEVRAWNIIKGTIAKKAAGKIHSDIEKGFIRAEVISYSDFIDNNCDESKVQSAGKKRLEGKEYVVNDGDIILYRFNV